MKRVLVVDDKEENLYYLRALLGGHGWDVDTAHHGAEALVKARRARPQLIISDLLMPVMDGYALLRRWRADPELRSVPFVVYTATYTAPEDEQLALDLGADAFILKPCEPEVFMDRLRQVLDIGSPTGTQPRGSQPDDVLLEVYSSTLVRKLEEKTLQLQEANLNLQQDIEKRTRVEHALRDAQERVATSEALLKMAGAMAKLGGWSWDQRSNRMSWTDVVCEIHDVPPGTHPTFEEALEFYVPEHREVLRRLGEQAVTESKPFDVELQLTTGLGRRTWVRSMGEAVRDATGAVVGMQGAIQDIDDRRKLEDQLRQAQKMEAIGQLAGGVAHDFNNLLSIILSYSTVVRDELEPADPKRSDLEEVLHAGVRAAELTRQLLAFSRKQMLQPRVLDIGQVVLGMERMLRRLLGAEVDLAIHRDQGLGRVSADPTQVEQIVMNLVINARDAMPTGGKLTIDVTNAELEGETTVRTGAAAAPHVMLAVSDSGIGMDAATKERIFEPFFTTKPPGKGTGLGLSTVFGIVRQSGGSIWVYSELGRGTTFKVYLPCVEQELTKPAVATPDPITLRGTETILLVEDDDAVRTMTRTILQRSGYVVIDAQNAGEAFLIVERHTAPIDLLLTDVVMPRMSGPELAERLKAIRPELRILYMSGYTAGAIVHHGVLDAEIAFLQKPITPDALLRKIRGVLSDAAARAVVEPST